MSSATSRSIAERGGGGGLPAAPAAHARFNLNVSVDVTEYPVPLLCSRASPHSVNRPFLIPLSLVPLSIPISALLVVPFLDLLNA